MAKKRERITIDGELFIIENATTTNTNDNFKSLYQCYDHPSFAKIGIYDDWYDWFAKNGSRNYDHGVESYNCMQFTYGGFIEIDGILYRAHITKSYNRLYKVVRYEL